MPLTQVSFYIFPIIPAVLSSVIFVFNTIMEHALIKATEMITNKFTYLRDHQKLAVCFLGGLDEAVFSCRVSFPSQAGMRT